MPPFVNNVEGNGQVSDLYSSSIYYQGRGIRFSIVFFKKYSFVRVFLAIYLISELIGD